MTGKRHLALVLCAAIVALALAPAHAGATPPTRQLYVSLGDSYASGYQPTGVGKEATRATASPIRCPLWRLPAATGSSS